MASHQQPSPTTGMPPHHPHPAHALNGHAPPVGQPKTPSQYLGQLTEAVWTQMGMYTLTTLLFPLNLRVLLTFRRLPFRANAGL